MAIYHWWIIFCEVSIFPFKLLMTRNLLGFRLDFPISLPSFSSSFVNDVLVGIFINSSEDELTSDKVFLLV